MSEEKRVSSAPLSPGTPETKPLRSAPDTGLTAGESGEIAEAILQSLPEDKPEPEKKKPRQPSFWKPVIVLTGLCLVIGLLLSLTNLATKDIIARQAAERKTTASLEVLPAADSFTPLELDADTLQEYGCVDASAADNGAGWVITAHAKGFGGQVEMIVGFDADGKVTGVQALENDETVGVGTRALAADYLARYEGLSANVTHGVDAVSGATITSKAVRGAVGNAAALFTLLNGEAN